MPYFLVSHTALVEADDEETAAAKVYGELCDRENITFSVTADEHVTTKITIPTRKCTNLTNALGSALPSRHDEAIILSAAQPDAPNVNLDQSPTVLAKFLHISVRLLARLNRE